MLQLGCPGASCKISDAPLNSSVDLTSHDGLTHPFLSIPHRSFSFLIPAIFAASSSEGADVSTAASR
jgi:hypothetical protein